jgi:hypothetical protein
MIGALYNQAIGDQDMQKTTTVLVLAIGAVTIGIGIAPPAAADTSRCQSVGATTICGQGGVTNGGRSAGASNAPAQGGPASGGCLTQYGTYQSCNLGGGGLRL